MWWSRPIKRKVTYSYFDLPKGKQGSVVRTAGKFFAILMFATSSVGITAQGGQVALVRPPAPPVRFTEPWPGTRSSDTTVAGTVMDINKAPVALVHVRLRELTSGAVLAETDANNLGEFQFTAVEPGTYVVEMLVNGRVVAVSNAGALARFQSFIATVQLSGRWDYGTRSVVNLVNATQFLGLGSSYSMTATTLSMASASDLRPVDGGEPVSPQ